MDRLWTPWRMSYLRNQVPRPKGCIFCLKCEASDAEEHILYRGETCYVALNRYPYTNGHLMVIPYAHAPSLEDLDETVLSELMALAKFSMCVLRRVFFPDGFNLGLNVGTAAGAGVADHVHLHVVPRWQGDTNYLAVVGRTRAIPEWLDDTYARLRPLFDQMSGGE